MVSRYFGGNPPNERTDRPSDSGHVGAKSPAAWRTSKSTSPGCSRVDGFVKTDKGPDRPQIAVRRQGSQIVVVAQFSRRRTPVGRSAVRVVSVRIARGSHRHDGASRQAGDRRAGTVGDGRQGVRGVDRDRHGSRLHDAAQEREAGMKPLPDGGYIGTAYGRRVHAREVVALDDAGPGLCWVRLKRFGDAWLLLKSDGRDVSRIVRQLRQIAPGEASDRFPKL